MTVGQRIDKADWDGVVEELDAYGCAPVGQVLTAAQCTRISGLYGKTELFRSTIDMERYRFGSGQYRYFDYPLPDLVSELRQAFYPRLLPIARDWAEKLGKPAPWPDDLDKWLEMCHSAGQSKSTPILLRYKKNDWNALHRDLYGDLVFPLQVVIGLDRPGIDHTGGEFLLMEQRPRAQSRATATVLQQGHGADLHHPRPSGGVQARLVDRAGAARRQRCTLRHPPHPRPGLPRRRLVPPSGLGAMSAGSPYVRPVHVRGPCDQPPSSQIGHLALHL